MHWYPAFMKHFFSLLLLTSMHFAISQSYVGNESAKRINGTNELHYSKENPNLPDYVELNNTLGVQKTESWVAQEFNLSKGLSLTKSNVTRDKLGFTHERYQQVFNGIPLEGHVYVVHSQNGKVISMNGMLTQNLGGFKPKFSISNSDGLKRALKYIDAKKYYWDQENDKTQNASSPQIPVGEKVIIELKPGSKSYRLCYKYDIYAVSPLSRNYVYVDAATGDVLKKINRICTVGGVPHIHDHQEHFDVEEKTDATKTQLDSEGTATTRYSGTQTITTDSYSGGYRLRESERNIQTFDLNTSIFYDDAVDFENSTNNWTDNKDYDDAAYDAHWGAEVTYDYFLNTFGRNSFDDNGAPMVSYIHYSSSYNNAFWDGERMTYGDGANTDGGFMPLPALDVVGHEFSHGVTEFTAGLIYSGESGALNEAFSDIFGTVIEFEGKPNSANFDLGEQVMFSGGALRSLSNPNLYENPDTYKGDYWDDLEEVHTNSGVGGHWFYLLSEGGSGTNDNNDDYSVSGIDIEKAAAIAYRTLSVYLTPRSDYDAARYFSIKAAADLYGVCGDEVEAVTNAWYAVGVGASFTPEAIAEFTSGSTTYCSIPASVSFVNTSHNASSFEWNFGDGSTVSTDESPIHTFTDYGTYTISLEADGGSCGTDVEVKTGFITISNTAICITTIPSTGQGPTQTECEGILYDDGGPSENYSEDSDGTITISPTDASSVVLTFEEFNVENLFDYIQLFDGPNASSPSLGIFSGSSLDEDETTIYSTGGSMTILQSSDGSYETAGFKANWRCLNAQSPPHASISAASTISCTGIIEFIDNSLSNPTSWTWDFGDGTTSSDQNPTKEYTTNGEYDISLIACNENGCDTVVETDFVSINIGATCHLRMPDEGIGETQTDCEGILQDNGGNDEYTNGTNGSITISPTGAVSVTLEFSEFSFESGYDYLLIYDGPSISSPLIGSFTGYSLPQEGTITSSGGSITLAQLTDGSEVSDGFTCNWICSTTYDESTIAMPSSGTAQTQTSCSGLLADNGLEKNYDNNTNGILTIAPSDANSISLSFTLFDFEEDEDYLEIYDGTSISSPLIGRYTGNELPNSGTITSSGNAITIRQLTNSALTKPGFLCSWSCFDENSEVLIPVNGTGPTQTSCSGTIKDSGGDLNYQENTNGSVTIAPQDAQVVTVTFSSFSFESGYDYLYAYDGPSVTSQLIGRYSGSSLPNGGTITANSGAITLQQTTDFSANYSGFEATWSCDSNSTNSGGNVTTIPANGTTQTQTDCFGTLKDNGGDLNYSDDTDGSITIASTNAATIELEFTSFDFESNYDYLFVYDGPSTTSSLIGSYSGSTLPNNGTITSTGNSITVRQVTDNIVTESGFVATWSCFIETPDNAILIPSSGTETIQTDCEGLLLDNGGLNRYSNNTFGSVTISPTDAETVTLTFTDFSFEDNTDFLRIYDGTTTSSPLIGEFSGTDLPEEGSITSSGPSLTISQETNATITANGFEATWKCNEAIGLEEQLLSTATIEVHPNPAQSHVNIEFINFTPTKVYIKNMLQATLVEQKVQGNAIELSLSDLPSGVYLICTDGSQAVHKFIIK